MHFKLLISIAFGLILSIAALYLAFRNVPFNELRTYLMTIDYVWILPTVLLVLLTFLLRVWRWRIILAGYTKIAYWQAFHPLMIGFMMNCVLPGRIGEIARPTILRQKQSVPLLTGLATVAAERLFDIIFLILLFIWVFGAIAGRSDLEIPFGSRQLNSQTLQSIAWTMVRLMLLLCLGLVLIIVPWTRALMVRMINRLAERIEALAPVLATKTRSVAVFFITMIDHIAAGFDLIRRPTRLLACAGLTVAIWAVSVLIYYVFAMGCPDISLSLKQWTTVMVVVSFFIALPSVPGFWGLWEAGGVFALSLFSVPAKDAVGFILVNHAAQIMPVILVGWISALITSINIWRLFVKKEPAQPPASPSPPCDDAASIISCTPSEE